jgi:hypothetical protein
MVSGEHKVDEDNLQEFIGDTVAAVKDFLESPQNLDARGQLRLSKTGTPLRKLHYEFNDALTPATVYADSMPDHVLMNKVGPNVMRFLIGHVTEALLLFLAKEAGHTVEHEQAEVSLNGIVGHNDAVIDGHLVDVKTASMFGYPKFTGYDLLSDDASLDPFGYRAQLSAYHHALKESGIEIKDDSYFWAYNKSNSEMCLTKVPKHRIMDAGAKIEAMKHVADNLDGPPPEQLCYEPVPNGKSGNMVVDKNCNYCAYRTECFGGKLRTFKYAKGPVHFTKVVKRPKADIEEIT